MLQLTRFVAILIRFLRQGKPHTLHSDTPFKVRLPDIDSYRHMNNARYLAVMDLGRWDLMLRSRWLSYFRKHGIKPVVVDINIRYRKELRTGARYRIVSEVTGLEQRKIWCRQTFYKDDMPHAEAYVGLLFLDDAGVISSERVRAMAIELSFPTADQPSTQAAI